ncbi:MAG: hypothetical protein QOI84_1636 [Solirubrobacterales bacterium]|nr:hypothetical protein [Solirubrobacterales bacterium]
MSIAAATRQAYARELEEKAPDLKEAAAGPDVKSAIERVTQWVPTEVVGLYVALLGLFAPTSTDGRWALLGVGVVLTVVFLLLNSALVHKRAVTEWEKKKQGNKPPGIALWRLGVLLLLSLVAFLAWACALPATPFLDWWSDATTLGGAAVLILAPFLPEIAELAGVNMPKGTAP